MTTENQKTEEPSAPACTPLHDTNDPVQQEISKILKMFKNDIMGITHLGSDGIMRSLSANRTVLSAAPFSMTAQSIHRCIWDANNRDRPIAN